MSNQTDNEQPGMQELNQDLHGRGLSTILFEKGSLATDWRNFLSKRIGIKHPQNHERLIRCYLQGIFLGLWVGCELVNKKLRKFEGCYGILTDFCTSRLVS